ncbi:MAG TPA: TMEM14 family protein [Planctomycetota bacterium]|nr:TMEM14 family protein [Planctomycetota bacterium]
MTALVRFLLFLYAVALVVGGYMGYAQKQSIESLIAGGLSALVAFIALIISVKRPRSGFALGLLVAIGVGVMMGIRFFKEPEPRDFQSVSFLVAAGSALMAIFLLAAIAGYKKKG